MGNYFGSIPIDEVFTICQANDVWPVMEDGMKWAGFISPQGECGSDKANNADPIKFELAVRDGDHYSLCTSVLVMTLCTMPSGRIEMVCYLS